MSAINPVFVCGMNGSGTTLLVNCLGQHSDIYSFPYETKVLPHLIQNLSKYGDLDDVERFRRLWVDVRRALRSGNVDDHTMPPIPDEWRDLPRDFATIVDQLIKFWAVKEGKVRWCEKTPMHALHISLLANVFSDASFIHVIRDGRDCAASFHRRFGYRPERTIYRWKNVVHEARRQGRSVSDRYCEVFYEDLTRAPELEMRRICEFLDVSFDCAILSPGPREQMTHKIKTMSPARIGECIEFIAENSGNWRTYFTEPQVRRLEEIAGHTLAGLGYPTGQPVSDFDPPRWRLIAWRLGDDLRILLRYLRKKIVKRRVAYIPSMRQRIGIAIRQRLMTKY